MAPLASVINPLNPALVCPVGSIYPKNCSDPQDDRTDIGLHLTSRSLCGRKFITPRIGLRGIPIKNPYKVAESVIYNRLVVYTGPIPQHLRLSPAAFAAAHPESKLHMANNRNEAGMMVRGFTTRGQVPLYVDGISTLGCRMTVTWTSIAS